MKYQNVSNLPYPIELEGYGWVKPNQTIEVEKEIHNANFKLVEEGKKAKPSKKSKK